MKLGIALGGGGARGLAHVAMLDVLDELGIVPHAMSGTSIGAIVGALYASGRTAGEIRARVDELISLPQSLKDIVESRQLPGFLELIGLDVGRASVFKVDKFVAALSAEIGVSDFEDLPIRLKVVAADFWARREVVFDRGPIAPAVSASFAIAGLFKPVVVAGQVLVDGGCVNPVPYDLLFDECDVVVAVDVLGQRYPKKDLVPSLSESVFNSFQIAEKTIVNEKVKARPPTIYVEPDARDIRVLDFHKAAEIYEQAKPARDVLRRELQARL